MNESEALTLEQTQKENEKVLKKFDELCNELGLRYYLVFGSLIGAIRHNGFIPWDDDLDVGMPREDFNILREYCRSHQMELYPFRYLCRENTKDYQYYIPRLTNLEFQVVSKYKGFKNPRMGSYIDIYPLDDYGRNKVTGNIMERSIALLNWLYSIYIDNNSYSGRMALVKETVHRSLHRLWGEDYYRHINRKIEKILRNHEAPKHKYMGFVAWETYHSFYPIELFADYEMHKFGDGEYRIPKGYDQILKMTYGDYMQMPPENKRTPSHEYYMIPVDLKQDSKGEEQQ